MHEAAEAPPRRFVFRDEKGAWVETHVTSSREDAIRLFCCPSLRWEPYERDGWTCTEELLTSEVTVVTR